MARKHEKPAPYSEAKRIIIDLGQSSLPDSLRQFRFQPASEIRSPAEEGPAVFLPTPVRLPDHDEQVEEIFNGFLARTLGRKPAVEKVVHQQPLEYDDVINTVRPYLEGKKPITLRELNKFSQNEVAIICRMIKSPRGAIIVSIPVYKIDKLADQSLVMKPLIAKNDQEAVGAFLVMSTGFDDAMMTDSIDVQIGKVDALLRMTTSQIKEGRAMGVLRPSFNANTTTSGTTGEFMDNFTQGLADLDLKNVKYSVDAGDVRNALKIALLLEASVSRDWQIAHEEMSAKQQLFTAIAHGGNRNAALAALSILFEPVTLNGNIFAMPEVSQAEISSRFAALLAPAFENITSWGELVKALNNTGLQVRTRQDEQLVQVMSNIAPKNMPSNARVSQATTRLGDSFDANPIFIAARVKTIMDIRFQMIRREALLGNLHTLVTEAQTAFEGKQAQALLAFINAAEAAVDLTLAADSGKEMGHGVNARFLGHTVAANADLPSAHQLEAKWSEEQERGKFISMLAQQAIRLLSDGADSGSSDNQ